MWDEQTDEAVEADEVTEPTAEDTSADTEGAASETAAVIDPAEQQGADSSGAVAAVTAPEVPDDALDTIARAQEHLNSLNMEKEREAAERTIKSV
jgi:hypothetical protein